MKNKKYDYSLIVVTLILVFGLVFYLGFYPEKVTSVSNWLFNTLTNLFGSATLLFTFGVFLILIYLVFSKYGDIRFGNSKPEYSTFSWIAMMASAGLGAATTYWGLTEWAYYYITPGPVGNAAPQTNEAYEWSLAYNFLHWGLSAWGLYCIASLPVAYHFYVRKNKGLSLGAVFEAVTGLKAKGVGRIADLIFMLTCFGAISLSLGFGVPVISEGISLILGIENSFSLKVIMVLIVSAIYSFSSYIGIQKGMKRLSDWNTYLAIVFALAIFIVGPSLFILNNSTNALGLVLQNFIQMSLSTSSIEKSGFPEAWTIYYWFFWITFTPFMALFVTKISKGRKIKEVIINMVFSGTAGLWCYFGVLQNYSMYQSITGVLDVPAIITNQGADVAVIKVLETLPLSTVFIFLFTVGSILFLATTLDSAAYTMAATVTPNLSNDEEPSAFQKMFWCVMLSLVPLTMILINAPLDTFKTMAIVAALPLTIIWVVIIYGFIKWLIQDYGHIQSHVIKEQNKVQYSKNSHVIKEPKKIKKSV
ncbi:BCCT family transporter [Metabacillus idriensis]|uniref:BCCT family transporter n=1 Tax=Metabacillus idriensis TaxID=324768 RepID=UPI00174C8995|nr:BCCT family transporter [Metabacillus idriensis]